MSDELERVVKRIETKLVRFAEELGVDIEVDDNWLTVDNDGLEIFISTVGRSLLVILKTAIKRGANRFGKFYDLVHKGDVVGGIAL